MVTKTEVKSFIRSKIERNIVMIDQYGSKKTQDFVKATEDENEYYNYLLDLVNDSQHLPSNMNDYQIKALRTASKLSKHDLIYNGVLGLNGESGELADLLKKSMFQGHPMNHDKMVEELGDVLWYVAILAKGLGMNLSEVATRNIEKLMKRYPEGFDAERSINRDDKNV